METSDRPLVSTRKLFMLTSAPIALVVIMITAIYSALYLVDSRDETNQAAATLGSIVRSQQNLIGNEIFLSMEGALFFRLGAILEEFQERFPDAKACVAIPRTSRYSIERLARCVGELSGSEDYLPIDIAIGADEEVQIFYAVRLPFKPWSAIPLSVRWAVFLSLGLTIPAQWFLIRSLQRRVVSPLLARIESHAIDTAIARMVQMISHDIRAPFSSIRAGLSTLASKPPSQTQEYVRQFRSQVDQKMAMVDSMLEDILESGRVGVSSLEVTDLHQMLEKAVETAAGNYSVRPASFVWNLRHSHSVLGDSQRLSRAVINIVSNALQATDGNTEITFDSCDEVHLGRCFVKVSITNTNSSIPECELGNVFDAGFTRRKRGGIGLGLAIVRKIAEDHGGGVECRSGPDYVNFALRLPSTARNSIAIPRASVSQVLRSH